MSRKAWLAAAAWKSGFDGYTVTGLEGFNSRAGGHDCARRFVTKDHGIFDDERANAAFNPIMNITATDAGVIYGDEDVVRGLNCRFGALSEGYIVRLVEDEGEVLEAE